MTSSVLQRFEKRLAGLVEGAFAKVFKGVVHPVEILNAMQREAEAHKAILAGGRTLVPNRYVIDLSPYDHSRLAPYAAALAQELAQSQAEFIGEQAWTVYGDVIVEIERGDGLDTGMFRVTAEVHTRSELAGVGRSPYDVVSPGLYRPDLSAPPDLFASQEGAGDARLVARDGTVYQLRTGSSVVGRGSQATLYLPDVGISRRHAQLDFDGAQVVLTDLGSTNGTLVNGQRISTVALRPGDLVQFGTTVLTFQADFSTAVISVYLQHESGADQVVRALDDLLASAGFEVVPDGPPRRGSWYRRFVARSKNSRAADNLEHTLTRIERAIELKALDKPQSEVDWAQADSASKLIVALQDQPNALIQIGSLLVVKVDGVIAIRNLSQRELAFLARHNRFLTAPTEILSALDDYAQTKEAMTPVPNLETGNRGPARRQAQ